MWDKIVDALFRFPGGNCVILFSDYQYRWVPACNLNQQGYRKQKLSSLSKHIWVHRFPGYRGIWQPIKGIVTAGLRPVFLSVQTRKLWLSEKF